MARLAFQGPAPRTCRPTNAIAGPLRPAFRVSEGGGGLGGALVGLVAALLGNTARRGAGGGTAIDPFLDLSLDPGAAVGADHAPRREPVLGNAPLEHGPVADNAAVAQIGEAQQPHRLFGHWGCSGW